MAATRRYRDLPPVAGERPETASWKAHRKLLLSIPEPDVGFRGCFALGLLINNAGSNPCHTYGDGLLLKDSALRWLTILDIPRSHWRTAMNRHVHLAQVRKTSFKYGMPIIGPDNVEHTFDLCRLPFGVYKRADDTMIEVFGEALNGDKYPQLLRSFVAMEWAASSTAFSYRFTWRPKKKKFTKAVGIDQDEETPALLFGQELHEHTPHPSTWMPEPLLAFPAEMRDMLYERATRPPLTHERNYTAEFKYRFFAALAEGMPVFAPCAGVITRIRNRHVDFKGVPVIHIEILPNGSKEPISVPALFHLQMTKLINQPVHEGDIIGYDGPKFDPGWNDYCTTRVWNFVAKHFGRAFDRILEMWFNRYVLDNLKSGFVHAPAGLVSAAAMGNAVDKHTWWNISKALPYMNDHADAAILPTVRMRYWDSFRQCLNGVVSVDLTPTDPEKFVRGRPRIVTTSQDSAEA